MNSLLDVEAIQSRVDAATPGPWAWRGNIDDNDDVTLSGPSQGFGCVDVMRTSPETVSEESAGGEWDADDYIQGFMDREDWIAHREQNPRWHLNFLRDDGLFVEPARDNVVFEVAKNRGLPDDTVRSHPKIYRADIVGVRNANALLIEHAPADLASLLAENKILRERLVVVETAIEEIDDCVLNLPVNDTEGVPLAIDIHSIIRATRTEDELEGVPV